MTALTFRKSSSHWRCDTPGCNRIGRYTLAIAGYPIEAEARYALKGQPALVCLPCRTTMKKAWEEASSEVPERAVEQAIGALRGSESERVRAVWQLRGYGFSAAQITAEVRKVALEREGVAA